MLVGVVVALVALVVVVVALLWFLFFFFFQCGVGFRMVLWEVGSSTVTCLGG